MGLSIFIANRQRTKKIHSRFLKEVVTEIFAELDITEAELGIALVSATEMAKVNWHYLQHEGSTDVITFDHSSPDNEIEGARLQLHGELFICVEDAMAQARQFKTTWQAEVIRYVAHGVLHLLGYDDLKPHLRRQMKREENKLVRHLAPKFSFRQL